MIKVTDQIGSQISLPDYPKRIISLVPSQSELLYDLDLDDEVVGITKFCVHPLVWHQQKTRIGGTKKINLEIVRELNPDLVIANREENEKKDIIEIEKFCPVWTSDISTLGQAMLMIESIGELTDRKEKAVSIVNNIKSSFQEFNRSFLPKRTAYLIWENPVMTVGRETFIHHMLEICGLVNVFSDKTRYPVTSIEELKELNTQLVLLSSEPFPFSEIHVQQFSSLLPGARITTVDGEMFSWYGSRLILAPAYLKGLLAQLNASG